MTAVFLALLGITGGLIVFEDEIDHWLNPRPHIQSGPERLSLNALIARLEAAHPRYKVAGFTFPSRNDLPLGVFLRADLVEPAAHKDCGTRQMTAI